MSNRQDRPLAKKLLHALGLLALALFLLYVAVQFVLIFHRSYKTETAIRYTLAESLNLTGVVAFDAVDVPGSGNLGYLVQDGERVTNGTVVAECYTDDTQGLQRERLDRLERSITLLTKSQNSAGSELSVLTNQTKQALYNLLDKLDTAQYTGIPEAEILSGMTIQNAADMERAAQTISEKYGCAVLCKGGHQINDADDLLWRDGAGKWFKGRRIDNPNTHGTGCTLSSAIASNLAKGYDLDTSVERAKAYISGALAAMLDLGHGSGPMNHMFALKGDFVE